MEDWDGGGPWVGTGSEDWRTAGVKAVSRLCTDHGAGRLGQGDG